MKINDLIITILINTLILITFAREKLEYFIHPRYIIFTVLLAGISTLLVSHYIFFNRKELLEKIRGTQDYLDNKFKLLIVLIISSLIAPFLFIIYLFTLVVDFKSSKFDTALKKIASVLFILIVSTVLILIIKEPSTLSSDTFNNRSTNLSSTFTRTDIGENFGQDTKLYSIKDWNIAFKYSDQESFVDKDVDVDGSISKPDFISDENIYMVSRFVISCCAVDATPIGLLFKSDDILESDTWINIKGKLGILELDNSKELYILPSEINLIEIPESPYVY